jgi:hypothetical protein
MPTNQTVSSPSTSTENLTATSRLNRAPSLPRSYRNRSGIPIAHREIPAKGLSHCFMFILCLNSFMLCPVFMFYFDSCHMSQKCIFFVDFERSKA